MKGITPERLYYGLLAHGLFAERLPPIFTSINFFDYCQSSAYNFSDRGYNYVKFYSLKNTNIPRQFGIPNPISYHLLCKCLKDNWYNICTHFENNTSNQNHKISRIHIRRLANKPALFEMNYHNWKIDGSPETDLMFGKRYLVRADISTFFPSIYTHSLSWALIGKAKAKIDRNKKHWYNDIDHQAQNVKHGETHGLLIGPHTSNLLSEIILTTVDNNLYKKNWCSYIRHIDDYTCYANSYEEGQRFLIDLSEELYSFDLKLNENKTSIEELPIAAVDQWVRQINSLNIKKHNENMQYPDVKAFLDNVIGIMHRNNDKSSILYYAMKVLSGQKMTQNANEYCIKTLLSYIVLYPYLIPFVDKYVIQTYRADFSLIRKFANQIYNEGIKFRNYEEVSFSLFFAIKYNFQIEAIDLDIILKTNNCIIYILSFLYFEYFKNIDAKKKLGEYALNLSKNKDDFCQNWIFVYESISKSYLKDEWKDMKENQVTFLKPISDW